MWERQSSFDFAYDGLGNRYQQTVDSVTTTYTLDIARGLTQVLAAQSAGDGTYTYLYGLDRIGQNSSTGMEYFLPDALGSVRNLASTGGAVSLARSYDPFGSLLASTGIGMTNYGFAGEWTDQTGLQNLRARYFVPSMGRFLTRDPYRGTPQQPISLNPYTYAANNPVIYSDPTGYNPLLTGLVGAAIGGMVGGIGYFSTNLHSFDSNEYWTAVITGGVTGGLIGSGVGIAGMAASGTISATLATAMVGGGTAAAATEVDYMVSNVDRFDSKIFMEDAAVSAVVGGVSSVMPLTRAGVAAKGLVYIAGAEGLYAHRTEQWTIEGAQQAAVIGAIGAGFDVGGSYIASKTFRLNTPMEKYDYSSSLSRWYQNDLSIEAMNSRIRTSITNSCTGYVSGIGAAYTVRKVSGLIE